MHFPALPLLVLLVHFSPFQFDVKYVMCAYVFLFVCICARNQSGCLFISNKSKASLTLMQNLFHANKNYYANPFKFEILGGKCFLFQTVTNK